MTPVTDFIDPVRFLVGDHYDEERLTEDSAIERGVRMLVRGGQANFNGTTVVLAQSNQQIDPTVSDPNHYMLIAAKVAKLYMSSLPSRQSSRDRGQGESIGDFRTLDFNLDELIYKLESGAMFNGWQSLASWIEAFSGPQSSWLQLVRLKTVDLLGTASFSSDGVNIE